MFVISENFMLILYITELQQTKGANRGKLQGHLVAKGACIFVGKFTNAATVRKMSQEVKTL